MKAVARIQPQEYKSKLEEQFAAHLQSTIKEGAWRYEPIKLRLAQNTFYTPDFLEIGHDGTIWLYEVKGSWRGATRKTAKGSIHISQDKSRVKLKVAAKLYPWFRFVAVTKEKGEWKYEEIPS